MGPGLGRPPCPLVRVAGPWGRAPPALAYTRRSQQVTKSGNVYETTVHFWPTEHLNSSTSVEDMLNDIDFSIVCGGGAARLTVCADAPGEAEQRVVPDNSRAASIVSIGVRPAVSVRRGVATGGYRRVLVALCAHQPVARGGPADVGGVRLRVLRNCGVGEAEWLPRCAEVCRTGRWGCCGRTVARCPFCLTGGRCRTMGGVYGGRLMTRRNQRCG